MDHEKAVMSHFIVNSSDFARGFGAYFGVLYSAKMCPRILSLNNGKDEKWYCKPLLCYAIGIIVCLPFFFYDSWASSDQFSNDVLRAYLMKFAPQFLISFIQFGLNPHICTKLGLYKQVSSSDIV